MPFPPKDAYFCCFQGVFPSESPFFLSSVEKAFDGWISIPTRIPKTAPITVLKYGFPVMEQPPDPHQTKR